MGSRWTYRRPREEGFACHLVKPADCREIRAAILLAAAAPVGAEGRRGEGQIFFSRAPPGVGFWSARAGAPCAPQLPQNVARSRERSRGLTPSPLAVPPPPPPPPSPPGAFCGPERCGARPSGGGGLPVNGGRGVPGEGGSAGGSKGGAARPGEDLTARERRRKSAAGCARGDGRDRSIRLAPPRKPSSAGVVGATHFASCRRPEGASLPSTLDAKSGPPASTATAIRSQQVLLRQNG